MVCFLAKRKRIKWLPKKDKITFESYIRADSKTPLAPMLFGASGKMIAVTAEQKSLDSSRSFVCVDT